jgi:hypothetical protein
MSNRMNDTITYNAADAETDGVYAEMSEHNVAVCFCQRHERDEIFDGYRYLTPRAYVAAEIKRLRGIRRRIAAFHDGQTFTYRSDGIWVPQPVAA